MDRNVCGLDRAVRLLVGPVLVYYALGSRDGAREGTVTPLQVLAAYAGVDLLATGLVQWCPTNYALGVDTCD